MSKFNFAVFLMVVLLVGCQEVSSYTEDGLPYIEVYEARAIIRSGTLQNSAEHMALLERVRYDSSPRPPGYGDFVRELMESLISIHPSKEERTALIGEIPAYYLPCIVVDLLKNEEVGLDQEEILHLTSSARLMRKWSAPSCQGKLQEATEVALERAPAPERLAEAPPRGQS